MSYGCGTVCLPIIRRALLFFMGIEATYSGYELFLKPGAIYAYYRFNDIAQIVKETIKLINHILGHTTVILADMFF
ncbi:hypothetical protein [Plasmodium yoelii yoelii]|uniref:Uncharacterized protein n=1 Tax=Plasmodium yoelii yoelii TaxID=73239 RepID=Q7R8Z4_PLAYO|nr:hypothetical protein [Plasmodium yoelii yoelii]